MFFDVRLQIIFYLFIYLVICLFILFSYFYLILANHFYRFILTINTSEDVIQTITVEMYMSTCLLHVQDAFQQHSI